MIRLHDRVTVRAPHDNFTGIVVGFATCLAPDDDYEFKTTIVRLDNPPDPFFTSVSVRSNWLIKTN